MKQLKLNSFYSIAAFLVIAVAGAGCLFAVLPRNWIVFLAYALAVLAAGLSLLPTEIYNKVSTLVRGSESKQIGSIRLAMGCGCAFFSLYAAMLALCHSILFVFSMIVLYLDIGKPEPDPALINMFSAAKCGIFFVVAAVLFISAKLSLTSCWWKTRFWQVLTTIGLILTIVGSTQKIIWIFQEWEKFTH